MKLLTNQIKAALPPLYSTSEQGDTAVAQVKFFTPDANWTWYATEFDGQDTFFGLVNGLAVELGFFSLAELEQLRGPFNLPVERDIHFVPRTIGEIKTSLASAVTGNVSSDGVE